MSLLEVVYNLLFASWSACGLRFIKARILTCEHWHGTHSKIIATCSLLKRQKAGDIGPDSLSSLKKWKHFANIILLDRWLSLLRASLMCMARHGMLSRGWGPCTPVSRICVKWPVRKLTYMKAKDGDTDKEVQVWKDSLISLSFQLTVRCASVSAISVFSIIAITTTHCTVHHHARTRALAWHGLIWRASMGTCKLSVSCEWDRHGRLVDACVPVDHASVVLAQACPNIDYKFHWWSFILSPHCLKPLKLAHQYTVDEKYTLVCLMGMCIPSSLKRILLAKMWSLGMPKYLANGSMSWRNPPEMR